MEQNQSQIPLPPQPQPPNPVGEWEKVREEWQKVRKGFAGSGESIGETQAAVELVEKWIWIQYQQQFKEYERRLTQLKIIGGLRGVICELLQQQKQQSFIITQKYDLQRVNLLIAKLRSTLDYLLLQREKDPNPQDKNTSRLSIQNNSLNIIVAKGEKEIRQVKQERYAIQEKREDQAVYKSTLLPKIKQNHRKIYLPRQLPTTPTLQQQSHKITNTLSNLNPSILNNKFLKKTFGYFCKQGYNSNGLFDDYSKEADRMSLNKWMVFCKEFDFTSYFHSKDIIAVYNQATNFASAMLLSHFLQAVVLLQLKYIAKFHKGEENFVGEVMKIGTEAAFRVKMDNLKVSYAGPRRNFFEYGSYCEPQRAEEALREKEFQGRKRAREVVLIKGMFEEQLREQLLDLKSLRDKRKVNLGKSLNFMDMEERRREPVHLAGRTPRLENLNYSKLFGMKREGSPTRQPYTSSTNTGFSDQKAYYTQLAKLRDPKQNPSNNTKTQGKSNNQTQSSTSPIPSQPQSISILHKDYQNELNKKQDLNSWLTNVRCDTEQSDQILKQHLQVQKKKEQNKATNFMKQLRNRSLEVQRIKEQIERENEDDMIETGMNFRKEEQIFK